MELSRMSGVRSIVAKRANVGGMNIQKILSWKILSFLCVTLFFAISLNASILPALTSSDDLIHLYVISGTGTFSSLPENHTITVLPGQKISGDVTLAIHNTFPSGWVAPLIGTPSWGDKASSWWLIDGWVPTGDTDQVAPVAITAPQTPGVYHLIFAFGSEMNGAQVASATDWHADHVVWDDGNDLADLNTTQIAHARQYGKLDINLLAADGHVLSNTAVDSIDVIVSGNAVVAQASTDIQKPVVSGQPIVTQKPSAGLSDNDKLLLIALVVFALIVLVIVGAFIVIFVVLGKPKNDPAAIDTFFSPKIDVPVKPQNTDIANKLTALQSLRAQGLINDQDFEDKKREILGKL
jgi:hypothetical protein